MVRFLVVVGVVGLLLAGAGVARAQGLSGDSPPPWYSAPTAYHTIPVCSWSCVWYSTPGYYGQQSYSYSAPSYNYSAPSWGYRSYSAPAPSLVEGLLHETPVQMRWGWERSPAPAPRSSLLEGFLR